MQSMLIYRGSLTERILDLLWQMSALQYCVYSDVPKDSTQ